MIKAVHLNKELSNITSRVIERSRIERTKYLNQINLAKIKSSQRESLSCGNLAHTTASCNDQEKKDIHSGLKPNIAIVSAYNDMLSAHQPFKNYPKVIKKVINEKNGTCQFAGGVPAMCDGITQGQPGMELSLFSRDVIAQATAIALSHNVFDGVILLGVCDKIVPGLLMGALSFGHLPVIFIPAGPMTTGISNDEKNSARNSYAQGLTSKNQLLETEMKAYHSPGTCTFYGTANTNQLLLEIMGLLLPGSSFVNPNDPLREAFTKAAAKRSVEISLYSKKPTPIGELINEKTIVNAIVGLLASGGSSNLTIHLIAIAKIAGITITWDDFNKLSKIVPLLTKVYPNGKADINYFHKIGGTSFLIRELSQHGLLHKDIQTINKNGVNQYSKKSILNKNKIQWKNLPLKSKDEKVLRQFSNPFNKEGGLILLSGNLGRGIVKVSSVAKDFQIIKAPAKVFYNQLEVTEAFKIGQLNQDCIVIVRGQGPSANGMPELHNLTPILSVLQDLGYRIALITDGRMSGASGKVLSVVHVSPESKNNSPISKVLDGDIIEINTLKGTMNIKISKRSFSKRSSNLKVNIVNEPNYGRQLFNSSRNNVSNAELGAISII